MLANPATTPTWFTPEWDEPQLTADEMRRRNAFEWWYFDLTDEAADVSLIVVFGRKNPVLGRRTSSIFVELQEGKSRLRRVRNYGDGSFGRNDRGQLEVRCGPSRFTLEGDDPADLRYMVELRLPEVEVDLELRPAHRGFLPTSDGTYFRHRRDPARRTAVSFSAPIMKSQGTLRRGGLEVALSGRGYHDHPWGTVQLFQSSRRWSWSRAFTPATGTMFARVEPQSSYEGLLAFFFQAKTDEFEPMLEHEIRIETSDWKRNRFYGVRFPHRLVVETKGQSCEATATASLLDTPMYERSEIDWRGGVPEGRGGGWLEYYSVPGAFVWLVFMAARVGAFFWRPFPWFGR